MASKNFIPLRQLIFPRDGKYYRSRLISSFEYSSSPFPDIFQLNLLQLICEYLSIREILNISEVNQYFYQQLVSIFFPWRLQIGSLEALKEFNSQFKNSAKFPEEAWISLTTLEIPDFKVDQSDIWPILKRTKQLKVVNFQPSPEWYRDRQRSRQIFEKFNELHAQDINVIITPDSGSSVFDISGPYSGHLHINGFRMDETKLLAIIIISIILFIGISIGDTLLIVYMLTKYPDLSGFSDMVIILGSTISGFGIFVLSLLATSFIVIHFFTFERRTRRPDIEMEPILV